jgi:hypothetical protein
MLLIGYKTTTERLGFVADYCGVCREIRPFELYEQVQLTNFFAFYCIPLDQHSTHTNLRACCTCKAVYTTLNSAYANIESRSESVDVLIEKTYPNIHQVYEKVLTFNRKLVNGEASANDRRAVLRDQFTTISPFLKFNDGIFAKVIAISKGCLFSLMLAVVLGLVIASRYRKDDVGISVGFLAFLCFGLISIPIALTVDNRIRRKFLRQQIYPVLATMLRPLRPTLQELSETILQLVDQHPLIRQSIDPKTLLEVINSSIISSSLSLKSR